MHSSQKLREAERGPTRPATLRFTTSGVSDATGHNDSRTQPKPEDRVGCPTDWPFEAARGCLFRNGLQVSCRQDARSEPSTLGAVGGPLTHPPLPFLAKNRLDVVASMSSMRRRYVVALIALTGAPACGRDA